MTKTVDIPVRVDIDAAAPRFTKALAHLDTAATRTLDDAGIEPSLRELVRVRASQINGCAYCVDMHTKDARAAGESDVRLHGLATWREAPYFTPRERAALAFAESVTLASQTHVPDEDFAAVREQFEDGEIAALVALITTINAWNAVGVTTRAWTPGSYEG